MKWGTEVVVFLAIFFIVIIIYSFYILIHKEADPVYNFSPFPNVSPENLPNANVDHITRCEDSLQTCDPRNRDIDCSKNCGENFTCVTVEEGDNIHYKNNPVSPGNWCLPKDSDGNTPKDLGCGTYTGRVVWSSDGEKQKWTCVCLYPSLFGGDQCLSQRACVDPTDPESQTCVYGGEEKKCNYLVDDKGRKWDPNQPNFVPPDGLSPYAKKSDGTPMFTCACNKIGVNGQKYISLPNDPYNCHLDPCEFTHAAGLWDKETQQCNCQKDSDQYAKSPVDGICRLGKCNQVTGGFYSETDGRCNCACNGASKLCSSDIFPREGLPKCEDIPGGVGGGKCNPTGSYCDAPCDQGVCLSGSICAYVDGKTGKTCDKGDKNTLTTDYICTCPPGTVATDPNKQYCGSTPEQGCKEIDSEYVYSGKNCENKCVPDGENIGDYSGPVGGTCKVSLYPGYNYNSCCSGNPKTTSCCAGFKSGHLKCYPK